MERIFTNLQIEWLTNIKLLSEYEDDCFSKEERSEKFAAFVETNYPGEELNIVYELQVLREKGLIILEEQISEPDAFVTDVNITKKGLDYLTMLKEDFAEKLALNEKLIHMANKKDVLDYIEQTSTIVANLSGLIPNVGNLCQGAIPFVKGLKKLVLHK